MNATQHYLLTEKASRGRNHYGDGNWDLGKEKREVYSCSYTVHSIAIARV